MRRVPNVQPEELLEILNGLKASNAKVEATEPHAGTITINLRLIIRKIPVVIEYDLQPFGTLQLRSNHMEDDICEEFEHALSSIRGNI